MIEDEQCLTFSEAAKRLPKFGGRFVHTSTLWRWSTKGLRGVRLETRRLGGRFVTSVEALDRFGAALAKVDNERRNAPPIAIPKPRTEKRRERQIESAKSQLRAAGIL